MKKALQQFLKGHSEKSFELLDQLETLKLDAKSKAKIHRVLDIMILGEMYGLHTISSILSVLHIKSNNLHKVWQGIDYRQVQLFVEHFSVEGFGGAMVELVKKRPFGMVKGSCDGGNRRQYFQTMAQKHAYR